MGMEKALYLTLMLDVFASAQVETVNALPAGVEVSSRSGPGGDYSFIFNNTNDGKMVHINGRKINLQPFEMKILTGDGQWL